MLKIGIIGYGLRAQDLMKSMDRFRIPFRVSAMVDPKADEIRKKNSPWLEGCTYFDTVEEFVEKADVDGIMIATRCHLHTEIACKVVGRNLPLFLEKPIAISDEQLKQLAETYAGYKPPVIVSFPLRISPMVNKVRELLDQDTIGRVAHVVAVNDVSYGRVYFDEWYRNYDETGGLFLQKATHDFDYLNRLIGRTPVWVAAMKSQQVYGGDKPHDLRCRTCDETRTCPESTWNLFYQRHTLKSADDYAQDWCVFSKDIKNQDSGNVLIEYDDGVQLSYTQNFFARNNAGRRGARLYGAKGTIDFDWYTNKINVHSHRLPTTTTIDFSDADLPHAGGDRELCHDFLMAMTEGRPSRTPLSTGILSTAICLRARESAETRTFRKIETP